MLDLFLTEKPAAFKNLQPEIRALLLGTCGAGAFVDFQDLKQLDIKADHLLYDGLTPQPLPVDNNSYDVVIVALTERYIVDCAGIKGNEFLFHRAHNDEMRIQLLDKAKIDVENQLAKLASHFKKTPLFFLAFLEPAVNLNGLLAPNFDLSNPRYFLRQLNEHLEKLCRSRKNCYFIDINQLSGATGAFLINDQILNATFHGNYLSNWDFTHDNGRVVPPTPLSDLLPFESVVRNFKHLFWRVILDTLEIIATPLQIKLLIIDLDDTLWRGIAAEDDLSAAERVEGWPLGFAEVLLYYKNRGGLLAIVSKNNPEVALRKFNEIYGEKLLISDFVTSRIGWGRKSDYVAEILEEVNLLSQNTVFVDDNPREIEDVIRRFPDLKTIGFQPYLWRAQILLQPRFQAAYVSAESTKRTDLVRATIARSAAAKNMPRENWLRSLQLRASFSMIKKIEHADFPRIFELINKTNQFNTTGRRWTHAEMAAFLQSGGRLYSLRARDNLVDNGLIAAAVADRNSIVQMVLSCRVFGLDLERFFLSAICDDVFRDFPDICGELSDTGRNFSCHSFYDANGFIEAAPGLWKTKDRVESPPWIAVN